MGESEITVRLMKVDDFDAVVGLHEKLLSASPREYYAMKFEMLFTSRDYLPASLVAEDADGRVVGFVMGEVFIGEYGIYHDAATLVTLGVDPACQHRGVGRRLVDEFLAHVKSLEVKKIYTLVGLHDADLLRFFSANQFVPSQTISLERSV